jgi:flagellar biosynthetic protein FlhB
MGSGLQQGADLRCQGRRPSAARIREVATANNVPIYRDPPAARSMYSLVEVDEEIRPEHFAAVAAAINFVERVKRHME